MPEKGGSSEPPEDPPPPPGYGPVHLDEKHQYVLTVFCTVFK